MSGPLGNVGIDELHVGVYECIWTQYARVFEYFVYE